MFRCCASGPGGWRALGWATVASIGAGVVGAVVMWIGGAGLGEAGSFCLSIGATMLGPAWAGFAAGDRRRTCLRRSGGGA